MLGRTEVGIGLGLAVRIPGASAEEFQAGASGNVGAERASRRTPGAVKLELAGIKGKGKGKGKAAGPTD